MRLAQLYRDIRRILRAVWLTVRAWLPRGPGNPPGAPGANVIYWRRPLSRREVHRPVCPPGERWRGEGRGFRGWAGERLWA